MAENVAVGPNPAPATDGGRASTPAQFPSTPAAGLKAKKYTLEKVKVSEVTSREFFTNPTGKCGVSAKSSDIRDKSIKALGFWVDALNSLIEDTGLQKFGDCIKTARNVFALWNIFAGVIPGLYWGLKNMYRIASSLVAGDKESTATYNVLMKETRVHKTTLEKGLALVSEFGNFIGGLTYTIGFGLCSPIKLVDKCWKDKISANAKGIGESFGFIMIANHVMVAIANICDLVREAILLSKVEPKNYEKEKEKYWNSTVPRIGLNLGEKLCELVVDFVSTLKFAAPVGVKVLAAACGGTLGFIRVYREMEGNNTPDPIDEIYGPDSDAAFDIRAAAAGIAAAAA